MKRQQKNIGENENKDCKGDRKKLLTNMQFFDNISLALKCFSELNIVLNIQLEKYSSG